VHPVSRRTFSPYSAWIEPGAELVDRGFTIAWDGDGTIGTCRPPFKTREEAQAFADKWNVGHAPASPHHRREMERRLREAPDNTQAIIGFYDD
jgi:hypothetical protein